jgi:hypothetical protein
MSHSLMGRTSAGRNANSRPDHNGRNTVELLPSFAEGTVAFPFALTEEGQEDGSSQTRCQARFVISAARKTASESRSMRFIAGVFGRDASGEHSPAEQFGWVRLPDAGQDEIRCLRRKKEGATSRGPAYRRRHERW